jgi:TPR repeat protein
MPNLMHEEIDYLRRFFDIYNIEYIPIDDTQLLIKIYNLFRSEIIFDPTNGIEYGYIGLYYECVKKDHINAVKYYLIAIEHNNVAAMYNLALYYDNIKDHVNMEKYYLMATKHGCVNAMYNLARYYDYIKDYVNMEKYYLMATEHGCVNAMNHLVVYYKRDKKDIFKPIELYIKNHAPKLFASKNLGRLVDRIKIMDEIKEIWKSKLDTDQNKCLIELLLSFELQPDDDVPTSLRICIGSMQHNIDIMKLHFEYTLNGKGYEDAKEDFINLITGSTNNNS